MNIVGKSYMKISILAMESSGTILSVMEPMPSKAFSRIFMSHCRAWSWEEHVYMFFSPNSVPQFLQKLTPLSIFQDVDNREYRTSDTSSIEEEREISRRDLQRRALEALEAARVRTSYNFQCCRTRNIALNSSLALMEVGCWGFGRSFHFV